MPQAIWTGSISFGLVGVPVRMVTATKSQDVRFHQLEAGTGARIRYRKVSEASGDEVANDQIVKGYEFSPGQYVTVDAQELESLAPKATRQIEIEDFVDLDDIDPVYFEQPYYLEPGKGGAKQYRLLHDAMAALGKVAIGRVVIRSKEALVAIRPYDGALCLETMRFADEVLQPDTSLVEDADAPSKKEIELAGQLVQMLAHDFDPEKYRDQYREALVDLIERKAAGEEIVAPAEPEPTGKVLDLMAALEASLGRGRTTAEAPDDETETGTAKKTTKAARRPHAETKSAAKKAVPKKRVRKSA